MSPDEKLITTRCRLMVKSPFYGHMSMSIEWRQSSVNWSNPEGATLGIKIVNEGIICYWNPEWVDKISIERLYGAIEHVINHLLHLHTLRIGNKDKTIWGIATDMVVNGHASDPRIGYKSTDGLVLPFPKMIFIPDGWPTNETAEFYYEQMIKNSQQPQAPGVGNQPGQGKGKPGQGKSKGSGPGKVSNNINDKFKSDGDGGGFDSEHKYEHEEFGGQAVDDHGIWSESDVSEDEARQMINERVRETLDKSQGQHPGFLKDAIEKLKKPAIRWREEFRMYMGNHVGNRRPTFSRLNRRHQSFGTKGVSHHAAAKGVVIVDTSGSIGHKELEQFFAEIDSIASYTQVSVLLWDAGFQGFKKYRKGDWKKFKVSGGGGTDMSAPVKWLMENRQIADLTVMLTDGYCNWPPPFEFPMLFVITTPESQTSAPEWGKVIRMKID